MSQNRIVGSEFGSQVLVSVVTPCFNEESNLRDLIERVRRSVGNSGFDYEHILIDNASTDSSADILREEAARDPRVRVILNVRNFGHIRSPFHAMMQTRGDCVILLASDLQDPPELIPGLLSKWQEGSSVVLLVKESTEESGLMAFCRKTYYRLLRRASATPQIEDATGAGLYDREVIKYLKSLNDPYPYLRGLVAESGFPIARVAFNQPLRKAGKSSNNLATLYDMAMLGFTTHSRTPLRLVSLVGFLFAGVSSVIGIYYFIRKLTDWNSFDLGVAPLAVGLFFFGAVQLISIGIIGEYIGNIFQRIRQLPLVIERERINF